MGFRPEVASPNHNRKERAMKLRIGWSVPLSIAACLSLAPFAWADGTTSPGKNSVFVSASSLTLPSTGDDSTLLTATITKGKKKTVVAIEGMLTKIGSLTGPRIERIWPTINGILVEPGESGEPDVAQVNCPTINLTLFCTITGTWWLDIDAAEAANPGMFIGKALTIRLMGEEITLNGDSSLAATLTARVQKK
jgi:hypothetical protein